ncbi:MAG: hypothetical protein COA43_11095 [Robiginitomaculum sp.]|nr:MAG: hypothetical protein COA43_11095 [Robiginitomaculum sp.]
MTNLTKREQFAMAAMQGILNNSIAIQNIANKHPEGKLEEHVGAISALYADALIAELDKKERDSE